MEIQYMKGAEFLHGNNYPVWIYIENTPIRIRIEPENNHYSVRFTIKLRREFSLSGFNF